MSVVMDDSFIFCEELRRELQFLLDNPKCIPSPLCFYGLPGVGKTMFSKFLAKTVSNHTMYRDMNEYKEPRTAFKMLHEIKNACTTYTLKFKGDDDRVWERSIIMDEWHNATPGQQDAYKVPFETYSLDNGTLFILCFNTSAKKGFEDVLSPAMRSRCYPISFSLKRSQEEEWLSLVRKRYPNVTDTELLGIFDLRRIKMLSEQRDLRSGMVSQLRIDAGRLETAEAMA